MIIPSRDTPLVLVFSAHDPTGAAGIQADIEAINRNGGRSVSVLTAVTAQNTQAFESILPQSSVQFRKQAELLLADVTVHACKIGLVGDAAIVHEIAGILDSLGDIPVVLDPVLHAGSGDGITEEDTTAALIEELVPRATLITPNQAEALALTGMVTVHAAARQLLDKGCRHVFVTGADTPTPHVINSLYSTGADPVQFEWERLPGTFHGSGCTLASAVAARLARDGDIAAAVANAQTYTWNALKYGRRIGKAQLHPDRQYPQE